MDWVPVGSLAAEVLSPPTARTRGLTEIFPPVSDDDLWSGRWQRTISFCRACVREVHANGGLSQRISRRFRAYARRADWVPATLMKVGRRFLIAEPFYLTVRPLETALVLSTLFGLRSQRLQLCRSCKLPFIKSLTHPRQQTCNACRGGRRETARPYVKRLPQKGRGAWKRVLNRLATQVTRGTLSSRERSLIICEAMKDVTQISWPEWLKKWDEGTRLPRGRGSRDAHKRTTYGLLLGAPDAPQKQGGLKGLEAFKSGR